MSEKEGAELYRDMAKEAVRLSLEVKAARTRVLTLIPNAVDIYDISLYDKVFKEQKEIAVTLGIKASGLTGSITGKTKDFMYEKLLEEIRNDESREQLWQEE